MSTLIVQTSLSTFLISLLFSSYKFYLTSAVAIIAPPSTSNLTLVVPNAGSNYCTDSSAWIGTGSSSVDCMAAVQRLYDTEVRFHQDADFEFISPRAPVRVQESMKTPRKYTVGKFIRVYGVCHTSRLV